MILKLPEPIYLESLKVQKEQDSQISERDLYVSASVVTLYSSITCAGALCSTGVILSSENKSLQIHCFPFCLFLLLICVAFVLNCIFFPYLNLLPFFLVLKTSAEGRERCIWLHYWSDSCNSKTLHLLPSTVSNGKVYLSGLQAVMDTTFFWNGVIPCAFPSCFSIRNISAWLRQRMA